jgi:hypothetical protein
MNCNECEHWKGGEGTKKCLRCKKFHIPDKQPLAGRVEYYSYYGDVPSPTFDKSMWPDVAEHPVWPMLRNMKKRNATMLIQYHCLSMTRNEIAAFHGISLATVYKVVKP